jgi:hypothetical protein
VLSDREQEALSEAQSPVQIKESGRAHLLEALEPHRSRDHYRWAFPIGVILTLVLTVPGPSTLVDAELTARKRPPRPRTRRGAVTLPVGRPSPGSRSVRPPSAA